MKKPMRDMFLRNLNLVPTTTITNLNQGLVLHLNPQHIFSIHDDDHHHHKETEQHAEEKLEFPISLTNYEDQKNSIILYTTSMRGIRKTFQDCNTIRFLLRSFKVKYHERDVSLHLEYREELWKILGGKVIPPKLFVKGKYIGGADEVVGLHEMGLLGKLLEGTPAEVTGHPCVGCADVTFAICSNCSGSRKVLASNSSDEESFIRCPDCNENGLVKCTICC